MGILIKTFLCHYYWEGGKLKIYIVHPSSRWSCTPAKKTQSMVFLMKVYLEALSRNEAQHSESKLAFVIPFNSDALLLTTFSVQIDIIVLRSLFPLFLCPKLKKQKHPPKKLSVFFPKAAAKGSFKKSVVIKDCLLRTVFKDCHQTSPKVLLKWWLSLKIVIKHRPKFYWSDGCL